jgi:hypothetical protein
MDGSNRPGDIKFDLSGLILAQIFGNSKGTIIRLSIQVERRIILLNRTINLKEIEGE